MKNPEILVIDDEKEMLVSYQKILDRAGYSVKTCQSAEEALDKLHDNHNFFLFTDTKNYQLPG